LAAFVLLLHTCACRCHKFIYCVCSFGDNYNFITIYFWVTETYFQALLSLQHTFCPGVKELFTYVEYLYICLQSLPEKTTTEIRVPAEKEQRKILEQCLRVTFWETSSLPQHQMLLFYIHTRYNSHLSRLVYDRLGEEQKKAKSTSLLANTASVCPAGSLSALSCHTTLGISGYSSESRCRGFALFGF